MVILFDMDLSLDPKLQKGLWYPSLCAALKGEREKQWKVSILSDSETGFKILSG